MKMKKLHFAVIISLLIGFTLTQFNCLPKTSKTKKLHVFTSILPQIYFVKKIGGDRVQVEALLKPGKNLITYEPLPAQVIQLSKADVFFTIGVPFETALLEKIKSTSKKITVVDTSAKTKKIPLASHIYINSHTKTKKILDPHIWLSPILVKEQASIIYNTLLKKDPQGSQVYKAGYDKLLTELNNIHREIKSIFAPIKGKIMLVYHPTFSYFAKEYGLKQIAIESHGKKITPSNLKRIIIKVKKLGVKTIFTQPEFSQKNIQTIAKAIKGKVIILNPLNPDYIKSMRNLAATIKLNMKK